RLRGGLRALAVQLQETVQGEQLLPALLLQLAPAVQCFLRQPDPRLLRVCEAEDPRPAVARSARMAELELLVDDDVVTVSIERPGGREPVQPGADDRDVTHGAGRPCSAARRSPPPPARPPRQTRTNGRRRARGCSPFRPSRCRGRLLGTDACSAPRARRSAPTRSAGRRARRASAPRR